MGALFVGENTAVAVAAVAVAVAEDGELVVEVVADKMRDVEDECDKDNVIRGDGEEGVALVAALLCSVVDIGAGGAGQGAEGVAAGQRRRSANAERDLRSCLIVSHDDHIPSNILDNKINRINVRIKRTVVTLHLTKP